ncbi:MAG: gp58-like family protein [Lachnospira sp.]|nr:gp58-like family protein [Lachnospira sp.]
MVNYQYAELFKKDSIDKQLTIETDDKTTKITNVELHQEQFELMESICSEAELTIGSCEAAVLKFTVSNIFLPMKDKMITVKTVIDNNTSNPFQIGRYKVYSDTPTADRTKRDIVAYDRLYDVINADVAEWYNTLLPEKDSTTTMKAFRDSFFGYFGIEQADAQLVNDDMKVEKTVEPEELSGATVLNCICEINGCFGHIGRDSKFHYIYLEQEIQGLYPRNNLYPADDLYPREPKSTRISKSLYISAQYEDFLVKTIDKLQIRKEEDDIGVIVGSGTNAYVIQDNFLVYGKGSEELTGIANNIYEKIRGIIYRPFSADCKGNPCIEVGDAVRLPTRYEIIESYVLKRTLKGIQALRDDYEATGEEYRSTQVNSVHKSIIQLKGKTNVLTRTIEETNSKITDVESGLSSEIKQTATDIRTEVKNTADGLSSSIEQTANSIRSEVSDSVNNLSSSIQQNTESITSEVKRASEAEGSLSTKITQTAESITSEVSKNYETKENATNTKTELESSIKQTADGISAEVTRKLQSYSTTEQMNSAIRQTADSINTEVSKKVNGDEIISKINQSAENVSIEANKINLNGAVTANQNFKIGLDGSMEALSGLIGEWQIFDGYLRYVLGENAQALLKPDELLISRSAGANFHAYPGLLYMQSDDGERSISIDCNDGSINLGGSWTTPWGDIEG